jgi:hypothetical protein
MAWPVIRREQKRRAVLIGATAVAALQVDVIPTLAQTSEKAASGGRGAALSRRPKNLGPFQREPVIAKATLDRDLDILPVNLAGKCGLFHDPVIPKPAITLYW